MKKFVLIFIIILGWSLNVYSIDVLPLPRNTYYLKILNLKLKKISKPKEVVNKAEKSSLSRKESISKKSPEIKLTGVFMINKKFFAILNGESYTEGGQIKDFVVKRIEINRVILVSKKTNRVLELKIGR